MSDFIIWWVKYNPDYNGYSYLMLWSSVSSMLLAHSRDKTRDHGASSWNRPPSPQFSEIIFMVLVILS